MPSVSVAPSPSDSASLTWPTITPRTFTSALRGQLHAGRCWWSRVTSSNGGELLGEDGADQPDAEGQQADEHDAEDAVVVEESVIASPPI